MPDPDAQRSLTSVVLDPCHAIAVRKQTVAELKRSIRRFGRLVSIEQGARLASTLSEEVALDFRADLLTIVRALGNTSLRVDVIRSPVPTTTPTPVQRTTIPELEKDP